MTTIAEEHTGECLICLDAKVTHITVRCGHMCLCGACAQRVTECPVCRKQLEGTIKVFFSTAKVLQPVPAPIVPQTARPGLLALMDAEDVNEVDAKEQWRLVEMTLHFMNTHPILDETSVDDCIAAFELTMCADFVLHPDQKEWAREVRARLVEMWEEKVRVMHPTKLDDPTRQLWFAKNVEDSHLKQKTNMALEFQRNLFHRLMDYFGKFFVPTVRLDKVNTFWKVNPGNANFVIHWSIPDTSHAMRIVINKGENTIFDEHFQDGEPGVVLTEARFPSLFQDGEQVEVLFRKKVLTGEYKDFESHQATLTVDVPIDLHEKCAQLLVFTEESQDRLVVVDDDDADTEPPSEMDDADGDVPQEAPEEYEDVEAVATPVEEVPPPPAPWRGQSAPLGNPYVPDSHLWQQAQAESTFLRRHHGGSSESRGGESSSNRRRSRSRTGRSRSYLASPQNSCPSRFTKSKIFGMVEDTSFYRTTYAQSDNGRHMAKLCLHHDRALNKYCNDRACNLDHVDTETDIGNRHFGQVMQSLPYNVRQQYL